VNYGKDDTRFAEIELADFGSTLPRDTKYAKEGDSELIGAAL
jgi:hypothetical protein